MAMFFTNLVVNLLIEFEMFGCSPKERSKLYVAIIRIWRYNLKMIFQISKTTQPEEGGHRKSGTQTRNYGVGVLVLPIL